MMMAELYYETLELIVALSYLSVQASVDVRQFSVKCEPSSS
jgi:hypothetical protein